MSIETMTLPTILSADMGMMTTAEVGLITGKQLLAMGNIGRTELVKGRINYFMPTGHPHSFVEGNFTFELGKFARETKLGRVMPGEVGIYTERNPDSVRAADVAFISHDRLKQAKPQGYLDVAPELVVEVLSPDDSWSEVNEKLEEYFAIRVAMVWVADPRRQVVYVYRAINEFKKLTKTDILSGEEILPGFSVAVAELFA
jgi:Uma2 family endonuclease